MLGVRILAHLAAHLVVAEDEVVDPLALLEQLLAGQERLGGRDAGEGVELQMGDEGVELTQG